MGYFISALNKTFPASRLDKRPDWIVQRNLLGTVYDGYSSYSFYSHENEKVLKVKHQTGIGENVEIEYYLLNQGTEL